MVTTSIATTPKGKLAYMITVVDPRASKPADREAWLNSDGTGTEAFGSHEPYVSFMFVHEARYEAERYMQLLSNAKFTEPNVVDLSGYLHKKMCLIGIVDTASFEGLHMRFKTGVRLRLWRVMICEDGMLRIKENTNFEVNLEWINHEAPVVSKAPEKQNA
jgi:hypothetical protein